MVRQKGDLPDGWLGRYVVRQNNCQADRRSSRQLVRQMGGGAVWWLGRWVVGHMGNWVDG